MMNNTASKYQTLVRILDEIRAEAPSEMTSYHPLETDSDNLDKARAKAFIHLYLKVKYGLLDFAEREKWVTESTNDGGIDAYYIDRDKKVIYFVQSKFRGSDSNFCSKEIELREILAMDIDRVTAGETAYENGAEYSGKIKGLQRKINEIENIGQYTYVVVILANLTKITPAQLRRLLGGFPVEVFDFNRCYDELVFPVVSGTYYSSADLFININLTNREVSASRISYPVFTEAHECEITVMFVPTIEIAKIMRKYKNSILRFNPRSYLDLSKNTVNQEIAISITDRKSNEFALFNNGITMLSDETNINERVGKKGEGQLHVKNPQIISTGLPL